MSDTIRVLIVEREPLFRRGLAGCLSASPNLELVGNAATAQLGFDCLSKGGKLVIVGLFGGGAPWALPLIPIKAITIQGSYVGNLRETKELLDLVRTKKIAPIPVTTMPLAQANQALVDLQKGKLVGRAVLTP